METVLGILAAAVVVAAAFLVVRRLQPSPSSPRPRPWKTDGPDGDVVVLDLVAEDASTPSVERLVEEVGRRAMLTDPGLSAVEVRDREGHVLGRVTPPPPLPAEIALPPELHEPHLRRSRVPSPVPTEGTSRPAPTHDEEPVEAAHRPFAEQFDLDPRIREHLEDPDRPVDLLRAILLAAGHLPEVVGDMVVVEDLAVVVLPDLGHGVEDALARAFLRIRSAGAARGMIVHLGWRNPEALRRRELAAPEVRHVGAEALQRMADAVAAGADPLAFAVGPAVVR